VTAPPPALTRPAPSPAAVPPVRTSRRRLTVATVTAAALMLVGILFSASLGEVRVPLVEVLGTLAGRADPFAELVVIEFRLPRILAGTVVGASLGLSGAILQSIARNPLASPDVLGINAGASVAAVSVVILAGSAGGVSGPAAGVGLPVAALSGALASGLLLYLLAIRGRRLEPMRLVVVGVGISAAGTSMVAWLLTLGDVVQVGSAITWLTGSLHASTWPRVLGATWALALAAPLLVAWSRRLDALVLGDDAAGGLGVAVDRTRGLLLLVATALAGAATSGAGAVTFLALAAPQLAQGLAGVPRPPFLCSAFTGAALLVWADLVARQGLSWVGHGATELPVGVLTAVLGAPYLLYVVARRATDRGVS
jgi:iron complex transport system permease protein